MKKISKLFYSFILLIGLVSISHAQDQIAIPAELQELNAAKTTLINGQYWLLSDNSDTLYFAAYSKPQSDGIMGFKGETPLLILFDKHWRIDTVMLLNNVETPRFVNRVIDSGLFTNWKGMTIDEALTAQVDAVSGATYTSNSVINSLKAELKFLSDNKVQQDSSHMWIWALVAAIVACTLFFVISLSKKKE